MPEESAVILSKEDRTVIAINSIVKMEMTSLEVAEFTGKRHDHVMRDINRVSDEISAYCGGLPKFGESNYINSGNKSMPMLIMDSELSLTLLTGYYPAARLALIRRWKELEEIVANQQSKVSAESALRMVMIACDGLRVSDNSRLMCTQKCFETYGVSTAMLPIYTSTRSAIKSATDLLKDHGVEISAIAFNKLLVSNGVLEEIERSSTKTPGKIKRFKALSTPGLRYGENMASPQNPREVQPMYYANEFGILLTLVGLK